MWLVALCLYCSTNLTERALADEQPRPSLALQVGHSLDVDRMIFSPDGRTLASGTWDERQTRVWDVEAAGVLAVLEGYPLCFSHDGTLLVTGTQGRALIWQARTGALKHILDGHPQWVFCADFSPDDDRLATMSLGQSFLPFPAIKHEPSASQALSAAPVVLIWDVETGEELRRIDSGSDRVGYDEQSVLAFGLDGDTLSVACCSQQLQRGTLNIWFDDGAAPRVADVPIGSFAVFGANGSLMMTDSPSGELVIIDISTGETRTPIIRPRLRKQSALAFSADGATIAVSNDAGGVDVHRANDHSGVSPRLEAPPIAGNERINTQVFPVALSPQGDMVAWATSAEGVVAPRSPVLLFGDLDSGELRSTAVSGPVSAIEFSPRGDMVAAAVGQRIELLDPANGHLIATLSGRSPCNAGTAALTRGILVSIAGRGGGLWLWDTATARPRPIAHELFQSVGAPASGAAEMVLSPDGSVVAVMASSGEVILCNLATEQISGRLGCIGLPVLFSPDGAVLAVQHRGRRPFDTSQTTVPGRDCVTLWDVQTNECLTTLEPAQKVLCFSADGKRLLTVDYGASWLWSVPEGKPLTVIANYGSSGIGKDISATFSPDSTAFANTGAGVALQQVEGEEPITTVGGGVLYAFSPNFPQLAVVGPEGGPCHLTIVDTQTGHTQRSDRVGDGAPVALAYSPDGAWVAICYISSDGDVIVRPAHAHTSRWGSTFSAGKARGLMPQRDLSIVFSADSCLTALRDQGHPPFPAASAAAPTLGIWEVETGRPVSLTLPEIIERFPVEYSRPRTVSGASVSMHEPTTGRDVATLVLLPPAGVPSGGEKPILIDARPIEIDARPIEFDSRGGFGAGAEWFVGTPEGYFDCSVNGARFIMWNVGGQLYPAERFIKRFRRPDLVRRALAGESIDAEAMTIDHIPPEADFVGLSHGEHVSGGRISVTVAVRGSRPIAGAELLVNGRPPTLEEQTPVQTSASTEGADHVASFDYRLSLPEGAPVIHLRAVAWDDAGIASAPVMVSLERTGAEPIPGALYVLAVGVSQYATTVGSDPATRAMPGELAFAASDARAVAERLSAEPSPPWENVQVRTLIDDQATLAEVRDGLRWLRESVRPGQADTVVVFLSGHGHSSPDGRYTFATHDFDPKRPDETGLTAHELRTALGGDLRAKHVFLLVDTCHSGALSCRNDDLAIEIGNGVHFLASCGIGQFALESPDWGHGAFTHALLETLSEQGDLAPTDGLVDYSELVIGVRRQIAALMEKAGQTQGGQAPCVLFPGLDTNAVIATARDAE